MSIRDDRWDPDEYDRYAEGREDAAHDAFLDRAWRCADCGELWDPRVHPATRLNPAEVDDPECPKCGGQPVDH